MLSFINQNLLLTSVHAYCTVSSRHYVCMLGVYIKYILFANSPGKGCLERDTGLEGELETHTCYNISIAVHTSTVTDAAGTHDMVAI